MNEQRRQILEMLAEGKITADEAERLIDALDRQQPEPSASPSKSRPKYLRVMVTDNSSGEQPSLVNARIPLQLLRAGVKLASVIPPQALIKINEKLDESGVPIDLTEFKPQQLEELIDHLGDLTVDVEDADSKVRVFCE
jgi:hypothetical protein